MGASTFEVTVVAKSAADAYRIAREEARAENGHQQGYSGDIQTTHGFVVISVPPRTRPAGIRKLIDKVLEEDLHGVSKWGSAGCVELKRSKGMPRGHRPFLFFGWGAS